MEMQSEKRGIREEHQQRVRQRAKMADKIGFRYLSVIETGGVVERGEVSPLSVSIFPHMEPEELESFKERYIHESYCCHRLDLTVPSVRAYLGLEEVVNDDTHQ